MTEEQFGVFAFREDGMYSIVDAIRLYRSEGSAWKLAYKMSDVPSAPSRGYVARSLKYCVRGHSHTPACSGKSQ